MVITSQATTTKAGTTITTTDTILCFSEPLRFFTAFFFDEDAIVLSFH